MNAMQLLRAKNQIVGSLLPGKVAAESVDLFLSPRKYPLKPWEEQAELTAQRVSFGDSYGEPLSALKWPGGDKRILLMHGWESRATQMSRIAESLSQQGYEVIAIDAPRHGYSRGNKTSPVEFARAIHAAHLELGPFSAAVGHSMGCAGLAIAREFGVMIPRYVLISSPANMLDTLEGFAGFIGLPDRSTQLFIEGVGSRVGRPADEIDVGTLLAAELAEDEPQVLLIHAPDDIEVPFEASQRIQDKLTNAQLWQAPRLGHRRIIRDPEVIAVIRDYLLGGEEQFQPVQATTAEP